MSLESWKKVRTILERADELAGAERSDYLDQACGADEELRAEIEALLAAESRAAQLEPPDRSRVTQAMYPGLEVPTRIGPWKLEKRIGTGGMGSVWQATRAEGGFEQRAAVKLIKPGMDSEEILARFERERALLASLEHPWIARLYDGGTTPDGRPYLVMELVSGVPFDQYCADPRRTLAEKLELFARVCDAVDFAHQQLVVHRDLKPANVLVAPDGTPKLLDFGIAKVLGSDEKELTRTTTGQRILTPQYASPEQLRGARLSTRSDVFSLGVMLYEALTGRRPFDEHRTPDSEAASPSRTSRVRGLAGDLDTIVLKALRVEPERRYASAAALAADVRRHLSGEAVEARGDTWTYRSAKFVRRHRVLVAATGMVIAALSIGLTIAWTQYGEAKASGALADARLKSVVRFASSLSSKVTNKLASLEGMLPQREAMLRVMVEQLEAIAREAPDQRALAIELAWARHDLSLVLWQRGLDSLGRVEDARALVERAFDELEPWLERDRTAADLAPAAAALLVDRADCMVYQLQHAQARDVLLHARELLAGARANPANARKAELWNRECSLLNSLISVERDLQDRDAERRESAEYLALVQDANSRFPDDTQFRYWLGTSLFTRGVSENESGAFPAARADLEQSVQLLEALHAAEPEHAVYRRALAPVYYHLSNSLSMLDQPEAAMSAAVHAWEEYEATLALDPNDAALADMVLAYAYNAGSSAREQKDFPTARRALQRAYDACIARIARHPEHVALATTKATIGTELAAVLAELGETSAALELAAQSIEGVLANEQHPERGREWNYGASLCFSNQAECLISAARDASTGTAQRRERLTAALDAAKQATEYLDEGERRGELGADERKHFEHLTKVKERASADLAKLPIE